jgi:hypothetical protein
MGIRSFSHKHIKVVHPRHPDRLKRGQVPLMSTNNINTSGWYKSLEPNMYRPFSHEFLGRLQFQWPTANLIRQIGIIKPGIDPIVVAQCLAEWKA